MAERTPLKKSIRFEVFKRDKFICQYCGRKAPDVVLNVDHIEAVANGGGNEILNLVTSCFDCNSGKSDKKLADNSVIEKQRRQLELLQERREQIELMFEWKKSLSVFDDDVLNMLAAYIDTKIDPLILSDTGKNGIKTLLKKFEVSVILDGIDEAAKSYLRKNDDETLYQESVEHFLTKLGGVIATSQMPPIQKKLAYIKGICRNRLSYWDNSKGSIILNNYVSALQEHGWSEEKILADLESEIMPLSKTAANWTNWRDSIEGWTNDIKEWDKSTDIDSDEEDYPVEYISFEHERVKEMAASDLEQLPEKLMVLLYLGKEIPSFDSEGLRLNFKNALGKFIETQIRKYAACPGAVIKASEEDVSVYVYYSGLLDFFEISKEAANYRYLRMLRECAKEFLEGIFATLYLPGTLLTRDTIDLYFIEYSSYFNIDFIAEPITYDDDLPF